MLSAEKRARARRRLRQQWPVRPSRIMAAAGRLHLHQGSMVPAVALHQWTWRGDENSIVSANCQQCTYPAGFQKPPPPGTWKCPCGINSSCHYRFCRVSDFIWAQDPCPTTPRQRTAKRKFSAMGTVLGGPSTVSADATASRNMVRASTPT